MLSDDIKSTIYFSKFSVFRQDAIRFYRQLERQQYFSTDELEHLNWQKRKALVSHAFKNVPYYRKKYSEVGFESGDLKKAEDFEKLPLLTKQEIRENFSDLISVGTKKTQIRLSTTGGSTGEPLKVYFDRSVSLDAFGWRIRKWWGVLPGVNEAIIARKPDLSKYKEWLNSCIWLPSKRIRLDASCLRRQDIEDFIVNYRKIKPKLIWGYVGAIDHVAGFIENADIDLPSASAVWVTSSPVTKIQRHRIEKAFKTPVYDQYGCCEVFHLASECKVKNGLHIFHDSRTIEFVDNNGMPVYPGESGNIAVTDLENFRFPILRYLNGDIGKLLVNKCSCGINLPLMDSVHGRQTDLIKLPDGVCLAGDYLTTIFDDYPDAVKGFQLVQSEDFSIKLNYVPNEKNPNLENEINEVLENLNLKTSGQVLIQAESVQEIKHEKGKLKYIISKLT